MARRKQTRKVFPNQYSTLSRWQRDAMEVDFMKRRLSQSDYHVLKNGGVVSVRAYDRLMEKFRGYLFRSAFECCRNYSRLAPLLEASMNMAEGGGGTEVGRTADSLPLIH